MVKDYFNQPVTVASFMPGASNTAPRASTFPCTTCGHAVAASARRCPNCNEHRPAPTMANLVRAVIGLAVVVIILVAVFGGFSGGSSSSSSGPVERVRSQYGTCLASAGLSVDGAVVQSSVVSGWHAVFLSDGAEFGVEDATGTVQAGNDRGFADLTSGGC